MSNYELAWLKDNQGEKIAPRTIASAVSMSDGRTVADIGTRYKSVLSGSVSVSASTWTSICNVNNVEAGRYLAIARVSNSYSVNYARISYGGNADNTLLNQPYGTANLAGIITVPSKTQVSLFVYASAFTATANTVTLELIKI